VAEQLSSKAQDVQDEQEDADAETAEAKEDWPASQQGTAAFASSSNASAGAGAAAAAAAAPSSLDQMTDIQLGDEERALLLTAVETQRDLDKVSLCSRWCCNPACG